MMLLLFAAYGVSYSIMVRLMEDEPPKTWTPGAPAPVSFLLTSLWPALLFFLSRRTSGAA